jgi:hypothetical protein
VGDCEDFVHFWLRPSDELVETYVGIFEIFNKRCICFHYCAFVGANKLME